MNLVKYLLYVGCTIPYRCIEYEISARKVCEKLGIQLIEMPEFNCCGLPLDSVSHKMMLILATQNLYLAEREKLNIMTLCPGCSGTLIKANKELNEDKELREEVNGYLEKVGIQFKGTIDVKHFLQVLMEDVRPETIKDNIEEPFSDLKVAEHLGCHLFRPKKYMNFDNSEHPAILKDLIEITGAECVNYLDETRCCGGPVVGINDKIPLQLSREKFSHIKRVGAQALITICPSCYLTFVTNQPRIEKRFGEKYDLPVLHYPQLLGLAMGIEPVNLGLKEAL